MQEIPTRRRGALVGLLTVAVALGIAELTAAFVGGEQASPVIAVGGVAIDATPEWLKSFAIRTFGERDKDVLTIGILLVAGKNDTVVRYALASTTAPVAVSRYQLTEADQKALPDEAAIASAFADELARNAANPEHDES